MNDQRRASPVVIDYRRLSVFAGHPARVLQGDARISLKAGELMALALEVMLNRRAAEQVQELHELPKRGPLIWTDIGFAEADGWKATVEGGDYWVWSIPQEVQMRSTWSASTLYPSIEHAMLVAQHHHDLRTLGMELAKEIRQLDFDADQLVTGPALDAARTMLRHSASRLRLLMEAMGVE